MQPSQLGFSSQRKQQKNNLSYKCSLEPGKQTFVLLDLLGVLTESDLFQQIMIIVDIVIKNITGF